MIPLADLAEPIALREAASLSLRYALPLGFILFLVALLFAVLEESFTLTHGTMTLAAPDGRYLLFLAVLAFLAVLRLAVSFILAGVALRQLTRSEHLSAARLARALEADIWPMLRFTYRVARRQPLIVLLCFVPLYLAGMTPVGSFGLLFDLYHEDTPPMQFASLLLALLSLAIFHYLLPYLFTAFHLLFHNGEFTEAEQRVRARLQGHRRRIFGGLLIASLPYYIADEFLFDLSWHPAIRHAVGAVFALPFITTAYLFYTRIELGIAHPHAQS